MRHQQQFNIFFKTLLKNLSLIALLSVFLIQYLFLYHIIIDENNNWFTAVFCLALCLLIGLAYAYFFLRKLTFFLIGFTNIFILMGAALLTSFLNLEMGLGAVVSSAGLGSLVSFIPNKSSKYIDINNLKLAVYCGSFIGMGSNTLSQDYSFIALASFISGLYFCLSGNWLNGFGGKLGTLAFTGVAYALFINFLTT